MLNGRRIVYKNVGEGNYKKLEDKIIKLLKTSQKRIFDKEPKDSRFPTIYLGKRKGGKVLNLKNILNFGIGYKNGKWVQKDECLQSFGEQCSLTILTKGNIINFVAESLNKKPIKAKIIIDNKFAKKLTINKPQLYSIMKFKKDEQHKLTLITKPNLAVYSFSFQ